MCKVKNLFVILQLIRKNVKMKLRFWLYIPLLAGVLSLYSCSASRDLPEDNYMLDKVRVVADGKYKDINTLQLKSYVRQKGNARWFSTFKIPLGVWAMAGKDSTWINKILWSMGEPPVVYDSLLAQNTCVDLQQALQNLGYLDAQVELFTNQKKKKLDAIYVLHPGKPYFIHNFNIDIQDSVIAGMLAEKKPYIHAGDKFSVEALNNERSRITDYLQDNGYFRFHKEFITFRAQKDAQNKLVDLTLVLHPYQRQDRPDTLHSSYNIRNIIYESSMPDDSVIHLRKHVLEENTFLTEGAPYSASALQNTYNHFGRLGAVKYTNIAFQPVPNTNELDAKITIQTNKPSSIIFQPEGTNTSGDLGAAVSLTYQNKNLFRGSETFSVQLRGAYEAIRGLEGYKNQDFFEYSIESRLSFPRFIFPFLSQDMRRKIISTSEVSVSFDSQDRPEFHRRVLSAGWRYLWKNQHHCDSYRLDLLDINYVFMPWISETFKHEYLDDTSNSNVILKYNYEDLFIMRTGFGYTYNNGLIALKTHFETAGNLLYLWNKSFSEAKQDSDFYRVFNIAYAQYVKGDFELSYQLIRKKNSRLVAHIGIGIAYPYGNSKVLPFEKRYFSGGANSVRGWSVRSLGPGSYKDKDNKINFITQTGDIKLDLNLEYRAHLFWKFGGALFIDAGNIWTIRDYEEQPGGQFTIKSLIDEMAVSYGLGLRLNFDYFILRFDLGMKAINPAYKNEGEEHFPVIHPRLSRDLAFHFAVGLPF